MNKVDKLDEIRKGKIRVVDQIVSLVGGLDESQTPEEKIKLFSEVVDLADLVVELKEREDRIEGRKSDLYEWYQEGKF